MFKPKRLMYGVASASAIFQSNIEQVFLPAEKTVCRVDDICVTGRNDQEHLQNLENVFQIASENGIKFKLEKCKFMADSIVYLGYTVDASGIHTTSDKIAAVSKAPAPQNVSEIKSFSWHDYISKFMKDYSSIATPLTELLRKDTPFVWSESCENAFNKLKEMLCCAPVLAHYNEVLDISIAADASSKGIGGSTLPSLS